MLIQEYKLDGTKKQYAAIDEAKGEWISLRLIHSFRVVQFIRNKCLRLWMDEHATKNDLQCYCAILAIETFPLKQIKRVRIVHRADGYYCQFSVQGFLQKIYFYFS